MLENLEHIGQKENTSDKRWEGQKKIQEGIDVNREKVQFIRNKTHPSKYIYKILGHDYIDPLKVRFQKHGIATNVYGDVMFNEYRKKRKGSKSYFIYFS